MAGPLTIARIWGIPISVHVSWLLFFALVAASLAGGYFPLLHPEWGGATRWALGALTSLAFFACILAHELGHCRVALRHDIPIRRITLFIFWGRCSNVALFNLLPCFPLDGGRVLRAAVWAWTGSFERSDRAASRAGEILALALIGFGVLRALAGNVAGGIWMVLIGWFLQNAVVAGRAEAALRELLRGATVSQAMGHECTSVAPSQTLDRLVQEEVLGAGRRCFVVADSGHLRGLLTLHEVKRIPRERWDRVTVQEIMRPAATLAAVRPDEDLLQALQKMDDSSVAQMPVVANGQWLGMLDREHIVHYMRAAPSWECDSGAHLWGASSPQHR